MSFFDTYLAKAKQGVTEPLYRNSFYLMLNTGVSAVLGFAFWIMAARFYPPAQVGLVSALIAAVGLMAHFSKFGFGVSLIRFLPEAEDKPAMINTGLTITTLAGIIVSLIFMAGLNFWSPALSFMHRHIYLLALFPILTVATVLLEIETSIFVAYRRAKFCVIQGAISGVVRVILPVVMVFAGVSGLFFSWGIGTILTVAVGIFLLIPRFQPKYRPLPMIQKKVFNEVRHFSFMNYIAQTLHILPILLLPLLVVNILSAEDTAYFRIAWVLPSVLFLSIPGAVNLSLFAEGSNEPQKLRENVIRAARLMLFLLIPGIAVLLLAGDKILLLFGGEYSVNAFRLLLILTASCIPASVNHLYLCVKVIHKEMNTVVLVYGLIAALTIGISYALMPKMGIIATGIGWTLSQVIVALWIGFVMTRKGVMGKSTGLAAR